MPEPHPDPQLEIAHVLFIDIVGSAKLLTNEQSEVLRDLNQIVRNTEQFRVAEAADKLIRLPTGDGMALAFFTSPEAPVRCAMEIGRALRNNPRLSLRMGVHSGPVDPVLDVNERSNVAGAGITMAQRVWIAVTLVISCCLKGLRMTSPNTVNGNPICTSLANAK